MTQRLSSPFMVILALMIAVPSLECWSQEARSEPFEFRNNERREIEAPALPGETVTVVSVLDYLPAQDDDFAYRIQPHGSNRYLVETAHGNRDSRLRLRLLTFQLPTSVEVVRLHSVRSKGAESSKRLDVQCMPGHDAAVLVEILKYWPNRDDDYEYELRVDPDECQEGRSAFPIHLKTGRGNQGSEVGFRITMLYWPNDELDYLSESTTVESGKAQWPVSDPVNALITPVAYVTSGDDDLSFQSDLSFGKEGIVFEAEDAGPKSFVVFRIVHIGRSYSY